MGRYEINEETLNKILLYTARSLPDRPGERGMKAEDIKGYFYKFIGILVEAINTELLKVDSGVGEDISAHNISEDAHRYLLKRIENLVSKDVELGDSIGNQIGLHNASGNAHSDIRKKIASSIGEHNSSGEAHGDIREQITALNTLARDAHNLASGKSKVHPCENVVDLFEQIDNGTLVFNVGDMVIFKDTNLPDFAVFAIGQETKPADDIYLSPETIVEEKKSYYCEGITFVALESGIDTSKLASTSDLIQMWQDLISTINELGSRVVDAENELLTKEDAIVQVESTASELLLASHTEYNLGLITELKVSLPENTDDLEVIINFRCGVTAPSLDMPNEILFQGDDTLDGRLYPITNRLYEINIKKVMGIIIAKVGAADYEVIE